MAYINAPSNASFGLLERAGNIVKSTFAALERRRAYRRTLRELQALSPRELNDLGLCHDTIARASFEATYGRR